MSEPIRNAAGEPLGIGRCPAPGCEFVTRSMPASDALQAVLGHLEHDHEQPEVKARIAAKLLLPCGEVIPEGTSTCVREAGHPGLHRAYVGTAPRSVAWLR